jgi:segregation and condensation protein A
MYRVQLQDFEGPLDLLLLLINRNEIDIFDIPIAQITNEYLSYVELIEAIDLDGVAEFIYFAALLISVKARMLLPSPEKDDDGEPIDPRQEIVERLLEYVQYKNAAETLDEQFKQRSLLFTRGEASTPVQSRMPEQEILVKRTIFDLIDTLRDVLENTPEEPTITIAPQKHSVEEQCEHIRDAVFARGQVSFSSIVMGKTKYFIVVTFLAALEMAYSGEIFISNAPDGEDFVIGRATGQAFAG